MRTMIKPKKKRIRTMIKPKKIRERKDGDTKTN